jgi:hypothetical protein
MLIQLLRAILSLSKTNNKNITFFPPFLELIFVFDSLPFLT